MTIGDHATTFFDRPVVTVDPSKPLPTVDGPVAWRYECNEFDDNYGPSEEFRQGFVEFLDLVGGENIEALVIGSWGYAAFKDAPIPQLCEVAGRLPNLRALFLGDITFDECEMSWIRQGDLTPLFEAYPRLEVLRTRGMENIALAPVKHGHLRELAIETGGLPDWIPRSIVASDLPALTHLELWLGTEDYGRTTEVSHLAPVLAGELFPGLRYLGLRNADNADEIAAALATAPVVARLETLDLSLGTLTDTGAEALLAGQSLHHLRKLDLHHHYLSNDMMAKLAAAPPGVTVDVSEQEEPDEYDGEVNRWVAVGE